MIKVAGNALSFRIKPLLEAWARLRTCAALPCWPYCSVDSLQPRRQTQRWLTHCSFAINAISDLLHGFSRQNRQAEALRRKMEDAETWMQVGGGCGSVDAGGRLLLVMRSSTGPPPGGMLWLDAEPAGRQRCCKAGWGCGAADAGDCRWVVGSLQAPAGRDVLRCRPCISLWFSRRAQERHIPMHLQTKVRRYLAQVRLSSLSSCWQVLLHRQLGLVLLLLACRC